METFHNQNQTPWLLSTVLGSIWTFQLSKQQSIYPDDEQHPRVSRQRQSLRCERVRPSQTVRGVSLTWSLTNIKIRDVKISADDFGSKAVIRVRQVRPFPAVTPRCALLSCPPTTPAPHPASILLLLLLYSPQTV
eukprot:superscaffoldBa00004427_g18867